jgi:ketosteroid isomerase-like protein
MSASTLAAAPPDSPQRLTRALAEAVNAADLYAASDCFVKDACFLTPDATAIRGREEIRPILAQLIARGSQIEVLSSSVLVGGGVALASERWAIRSAAPDGSVFEQQLSPTMVARWVEERWKLAVAAPWGRGGTS